MNTIFVLWFLFGILAGASHLWLVWRAAQPPFHAVAWHLPRLLLVGGVLFASALWGGLLPAVTGWMTAYFAMVSVYTMRSA